MIILPSKYALAPGVPAPFGATGGTEPYSYSVESGGAGGSINASTGLYTAPDSPASNFDTVTVTDALGATAQAKVLVGSPLILFCDIIQTEMGLADGQVYLWDQKYNVPNDSRLYIPVGILNCKNFANRNTLDSDGNSVQSLNLNATLSVDIMSRNFDAVTRKEEVIMALISDYSQSQQELNSFKIARIASNFVNLSQEDGAAILYRFNISVNIQYAITKTKAVPYYSDFSGVGPEVTTDQ